MYMAHVYFHVCCSDCVGVCGNVVRPLLKQCFLSLGVLKYVVCLCRGCDGCCVFCLYCEAWSCRCSCMGSVSVSSCRCCMFVSCVHPVTVLNAAFCMTSIWSSLASSTSINKLQVMHNAGFVLPSGEVWTFNSLHFIENCICRFLRYFCNGICIWTGLSWLDFSTCRVTLCRCFSYSHITTHAIPM